MINILDSEIQSLSKKHTFWTWSAQGDVTPIPVKRAEGVYFWDVEGKQYLDLNAMAMCVNIGHGNKRVIDAMIEQAGALAYAAPSMATKPRASLGRLLAQITPGDLNVFLFTLGGAEANENAIKLARAYTGRHKILARYRSYHGATHGAMALTGDPRRWTWEPNLMPGVVHFLDPFRAHSTFHRTNPSISEPDFSLDYLNHLEEIIQLEGPETIAAIMLEPVTGTNGIIIPPEGYLQGVRDLCDHYHILLIADEVMSGFGRTGEWFAVEHWMVVPDLMTMAKGLSSGYAPLGAVAMRENIADFFSDRIYYGGLTYNSHPISLASAIANIEVMIEDNLVAHSKKMGYVLETHLDNLKGRHPSVSDVRSIGLFGAIELGNEQKTQSPLGSFGQVPAGMKNFKAYTIEMGVFLFVRWNIILIIPPLIISEDQLSKGMEVIDEGLNIFDEAFQR